jgi:thiol-disulfide isomerase/thioredoxin
MILKNTTLRPWAVIVLGLVLSLAAAAPLAAQGRQAPPPEYKELAAATRIQDPALRLKEFERIKAAYPNSRFIEAIEASIQDAKVALAETLDAVLALQRGFLAGGKGPERLQRPFVMAVQLLNHPRLETFDHAKVLDIALAYRAQVLRAAADPASFEGIPPDQRDPFKSNILSAVELLTARAYLNAGDTDKAMASLEAYTKAGGTKSANYHYVRAGVLESTGKAAEALEAYLAAAAEEYADAGDKARRLYAGLHGSEDGFAEALAAKLKALPFPVEPFKSPAGWKGKTVLAELFTGSECPPCVGADLAFDGLIEAFPSRYLAVLVYHLPIPRPDPMMNPAAKIRADAYGVNSTPTVVVDGTDKSTGGGGRGAAEAKFAQYRNAIEPLLAAAPGLSLKASASLAGDTVKVQYDFDKTVAAADYLLVLVQEEQEHEGGNGIAFHKMVVRDLVVIDPAAPKTAAFDLAASEKNADAYLTEFAKGYRQPGFTWEVRRNAISRRGLRIVLFVQEKASGRVLNAVVAPVL